jgi:outer membrane protein OmpA-like peptidoglycan-associated protein
MIRKRIGIVICLAAIVLQSGAQGLGIGLAGGLQGTQYSLQGGGRQLLPGGSIELTYGFRLGPNWDLLSGVTGGIYRTQAKLPDGPVYSAYEVDDGGSAFLYSVNTVGYKETQRFFALGIPLLLQYHTTGAGVQWYINGGGKAYLPFNSSVQVSADKATFSGYYPDFNIQVSNLPQHGFGTIKGWKTSATADLKPTAALSAATGLSFPLSRGTRLYAGVFADYGLTELRQKIDSMPLMTYNSTGISGVHAGGVLNRPGIGNVTMLSFGVELRLAFGSPRAEGGSRRHAKKEPQQVIDSATRVNLYEQIERNVVFGLFNETVLPDIQREHLDDVAGLMKQYPGIRISLVGHICDDDAKTESKKVGMERAHAVAAYLESKGVDARRIDISPVVESDEYVPDDPPANYRHRRVVIAVE